jgi:cytohesin
LDRWRGTPLHRAAAGGHLKSVKLLLEAGAELESADEAGFTPLLSAIETDRLETVEYLLAHGASRKARTDLGKGPLRVAATTNALRTARFLLGRKEPVEGDTPGLNTPLIEAAASGHPEMIALLLEHGASPEARDKVQRATPLIWTVLSRPATSAQLQLGAPPKSSYTNVRTKDPLFLETARMLAAHKADLDATDRLGNTALHHAAYYGDREAVEFLLSLGASMDPRNARQLTPYEAAMQRGHAEIAATLQP